MKKNNRTKKSGYKKKFKGIRYISKVLKKYGGKKYKDYDLRLQKSREIYQQLKTNNQKVIIQNISPVFRKTRLIEKTKKSIQGEAPVLNSKFKQEELYYFDLINFPYLIQSSSNEITFVSEIFNEGVTEITGGSKPDYKESFSQFVNAVNKQVKEREQAYGFRISVTDPELIDGNWISRIISTDPSGEEDNFGFNPQGGDGKEPTIEEIDKKLSTQPLKQSSEELRAMELRIQEQKNDLEKLKQENLKTAMSLFQQNLITKLEFKEMMAKIK